MTTKTTLKPAYGQQIDARLRFNNNERHKFPQFDDAALKSATDKWLIRLTGDDAHRNLWMSESTYVNTPLRSHDTGQQTRWKLEVSDGGELVYKQWESKAFGDAWTSRSVGPSVKLVPRKPNGTWLTPPLSDLMELAGGRGLEPGKYLEVQVRQKVDDLLVHDETFGFYRQSSRRS